jgi:hypothetical protein
VAGVQESTANLQALETGPAVRMKNCRNGNNLLLKEEKDKYDRMEIKTVVGL